MKTRNGKKFKVIPAHELGVGDLIYDRVIRHRPDVDAYWKIEAGPTENRGKVYFSARYHEGAKQDPDSIRLEYTIGTAVTVWMLPGSTIEQEMDPTKRHLRPGRL